MLHTINQYLIDHGYNTTYYDHSNCINIHTNQITYATIYYIITTDTYLIYDNIITTKDSNIHLENPNALQQLLQKLNKLQQKCSIS